jgi:hypothetical protein
MATCISEDLSLIVDVYTIQLLLHLPASFICYTNIMVLRESFWLAHDPKWRNMHSFVGLVQVRSIGKSDEPAPFVLRLVPGCSDDLTQT